MKNIKIIPIYKNIKEKDFPEFIKLRGFNCVRFIVKNKGLIENTIIKIKRENNHNIFDLDCLAEENIGNTEFYLQLLFNYDVKNSPDFFMWNKNEFYFCEFKSQNDILRPGQLQWMCSDYPCAVAFVTTENNNNNNKLFSWKKFEEEKNLKIKNILKHKLYDKFLKEKYVNKNKKPKQFRIIKFDDGMLNLYGFIPKQLTELSDKIDKIELKNFELKNG